MEITTLADIVRVHAAADGDRPMLTYDGTTRTFGEMDRRSSQVAQALAGLGVGHQDRVAFLDKNTPEFFEIAFGAAKLDAVTVAVNWRLAPREIAQIVRDAQAKVLVVGADLFAAAQKAAGDLPPGIHLIAIGGHARWPELADLVDAQPARDPGTQAGAGSVALQLYTSGTTGLPKGVMLTNRNVFAGLRAITEAWGFDADTVNLAVMPLFHIGGSGWDLAVMFNGGHTVLHREVEPPAILDAIAAHGVTHALFVPAMLHQLLATRGVEVTDFSTLRTIVYGASPISDEVLTKAMATFGCGFIQAYGLTETTGAVTTLAAEDHDPAKPDLLRSCGKPMRGVELRIVDPESKADCAEEAVGEVWVRGAQNMLGYWRKPEETAAAQTDDGWFKTGDAGYLRDGYLYLYDRVKDMIVSGGENVYPAEVENVLMGHPAVADVAVIGVPHPKWGETVKAVIVPLRGAELVAADLIAYSREHMAHYKCPTSVEVVDALPRNPSGKVLKRELREPYWEGQVRRIGGPA